VNPFDLGALLLAVLAVAIGFKSGALPQVGGLGGAVAGGALALWALPGGIDLLPPLDPLPKAIVVLTGLLFAVGMGEAAGSALGRGAARGLGGGVLGAADRIGGAFVGFAQAVLVVWLVGGLLASGSALRIAQIAQNSTVLRTLDRVLPPPTEVALELGQLLDDSGLPDVFVGLDPLPAPPVDRPDSPTARAIAALAASSTARITAQTCGSTISLGSGFLVAPGYVVTNAHVVAGSRTIRVNVGGRLVDAAAVLFDPTFDLAVLHGAGLQGQALRFAATDPGRGTIGAALGYPGGGAFDVVPAAVAGRYDARGRDIYGESQVTRPVLELRAEVEQGDSGGPFVLTDGTVGGVVFAESRADPDVGYALTATSVATRVAPAIGRTSAVDTGRCLR
jgi:S1-C subfamily serine protease